MYPFSSADLFSPDPVTIQEKIRTAYNRAFINWQAYWVEAYRDQSFYLNNQWTPEERRYLQQEQRPDYVFNLTRACVNMVQGYQRKHRLSTVCMPVESSSEETADLFTKCMYHTMRNGNGYYALSDAFQGALVSGLGVIGIEVDYRFDVLNGDIKYVFYPWQSIIFDPFWTKKDLSDCDYIIRRAYMSKAEAISKFPGKKEQISKMQGNMRDDLFTFLPEQRIFQSQNLLAYTEYWEQRYKEVKCILNPFTLEEIEITKENKEITEFLKQVPGAATYSKQKSYIKFYALLNNELVHEDENPYNISRYPFVPITAVYQPEYDLYQYKLQSMIRCVRDAQIETNKRISKLTDYIDSQINTGWIVKKSKFDNPLDFYKTGQGRVIFGKNEADLMADARQITNNNIPQGLFELQNLFNSLVMRICGVNEELLGTASDTEVGITQMLRQGAGLINLQDLFDGLRQSQEILGNLTIEAIQNNWTPQKVMRVTKQQPTKEFYDQSFGKYDCVCVEAPLTETQQQLFFQQLLQFKQMGGPVPWKTILKAMPMQGKQELIKDIEQEEQQQQQMQQAMAQAEMQDKNVINKLLVEESNIKIAAAHEKLAKAQQDKAAAALDLARGAAEVENISLEGINKFIDTITKIENIDGNINAEVTNGQPAISG